MKPQLLFFVLLSLLMIQCNKDNKGYDKPVDCTEPLRIATTDGEDLEVIRAVILDFQSSWDYLIHESAHPSQVDLKIAMERFPMDSSTVLNFLFRNIHTSYFPDSVSGSMKTIRSDEYNCLTSHLDKEDDLHPYKLSFTLPGYSNSGNEAYIEMHEYCGGFCSTHFIILLEKSNGTWIVRQREVTFIT